MPDSRKVIAFDTETRCREQSKGGALEWWNGGRGELVCLSWHDGETGGITYDLDEMRAKWDEWRDCRITGYNTGFDLHYLINRAGWPTPTMSDAGRISDLMPLAKIMHYSCNVRGSEPRGFWSLDQVSQRFLGVAEAKDIEIYEHLAERFGGKPTREAQGHLIGNADPDILSKYAIRDTELTWNLHRWLSQLTRERGLGRIMRLETRAFIPLFNMEHRGLAVDVDQLNRADAELGELFEKCQAELGFEPSNRGGLFEHFGVDERGRTKNGSQLQLTEKTRQPSFSEESLKELQHPDDRKLAEKVLFARKTLKVKNSYVKKLLDQECEGRVYPRINQMGAYSGRLSVSGIPIQQLPSKDARLAAPVRSAFRAPEGFGWVYGDFSQLELRCFAEVSEAAFLFEAYRDDPEMDFHRLVAERMGIPRSAKEAEEMQMDGRMNSKILNFGLAFSMGAGALAASLGMPYSIERVTFSDGLTKRIKMGGDEVQEFLGEYDKAMPGVRSRQRDIKRAAEWNGHYESVFGRRIATNRNRSYGAAGGVCQSTGADINLWALCAIEELLEGHKSHLLINIHDEYSVAIHEDERGLIPKLREAVERVNDLEFLRIPYRIDFGEPATDWWSACSE